MPVSPWDYTLKTSPVVKNSQGDEQTEEVAGKAKEKALDEARTALKEMGFVSSGPIWEKEGFRLQMKAEADGVFGPIILLFKLEKLGRFVAFKVRDTKASGIKNKVTGAARQLNMLLKDGKKMSKASDEDADRENAEELAAALTRLFEKHFPRSFVNIKAGKILGTVVTVHFALMEREYWPNGYWENTNGSMKAVIHVQGGKFVPHKGTAFSLSAKPRAGSYLVMERIKQKALMSKEYKKGQLVAAFEKNIKAFKQSIRDNIDNLYGYDKLPEGIVQSKL